MSYSISELLSSNEWNTWLKVQVMLDSNSAMKVRKVEYSESSHIFSLETELHFLNIKNLTSKEFWKKLSLPLTVNQYLIA